jgi:HK97 family phage prohead protease
MQTKQLDAPFELKALDENGSFSGYGSVFGIEDSDREVVAPGAFRNTLADWEKKGRLPSLLWQHDQRQPIGVWTKMQEDERGLYVEGTLLKDDVFRAKEAYALMKAGALSGLSIGYLIRADSFDEKTRIRTLNDIELWECSICTFPANDAARIGAVKAALKAGAAPTEREFEEFLRDAGFSAKQAKAIIADGYKVIAQRDAGDDGLEAVSGLLAKLQSFTRMS